VPVVEKRNSSAGGTKGRPRTKVRSTRKSCSMQRGPIVSVLQPGTVHCVTIGMPGRYPFETIR
jgi:hypothetical protein